MNAYSLDLRERALYYLDEGHTHQETSDLFKICLRTVFNWSRLRKDKGSLVVNNTPRSPHKLFDKDLLEYVKEHPDAHLQEIANHFNCCKAAMHKAFKRLGITRKKTKNIS
jgi:transposase